MALDQRLDETAACKVDLAREELIEWDRATVLLLVVARRLELLGDLLPNVLRDLALSSSLGFLFGELLLRGVPRLPRAIERYLAQACEQRLLMQR